jgi:predicted nuclease of predicted toxin-antitoxin system
MTERISRVRPGITSPDVLLGARVEGRVLSTTDTGFNRRFALWGCSLPSVILLRRVTRDPAALTALLLAHLPEIQRALESVALVTLDKDAVRVHPLPDPAWLSPRLGPGDCAELPSLATGPNRGRPGHGASRPGASCGRSGQAGRQS